MYAHPPFLHFFDWSDQALILAENIFKRIALFLDQHQGDLFRQLSSEVTSIAVSMFHGALNEARSFPIETVERSKILEQPGNSQELCTLISETSSRTSLAWWPLNYIIVPSKGRKLTLRPYLYYTRKPRASILTRQPSILMVNRFVRDRPMNSEYQTATIRTFLTECSVLIAGKAFAFWAECSADIVHNIFALKPFHILVEGNACYIHAALIACYPRFIDRMINGHIFEVESGVAAIGDVDVRALSFHYRRKE